MNSTDMAARRAIRRRLLLAGSAGIAGWNTVAVQALAAGHELAQGLRSGFGDIRIGGREAGAGQPLVPGELIATGPGAHAVVVVGADAFLLRERSSLRLEEAGGKRILRYLSGKVLSVFGTGNKQLITPTASIGIRGTACYIEASAERTYFCLCYGSAEIRPHANPDAVSRLETTHHERPVTIAANASVMKAAQVINHSDDELILLEATVGRRPPFYGKDKQGPGSY